MAATPSSTLTIRGDALDFYLGQGYYRMQQDLFTCRFLPLNDSVHTVHWLRIVLADVHFGSTQRRLLRSNARFATIIRPFRLTDELETLYALYRRSITFDAPETIESFLLAGATHSIFNTEIVEIRDGAQLIAAGILDCGAQTVAGIMNFYHPDYRKQSLGKYLMLLKINYALSRRMAYYYPGYVVHDYPKFDYKLFPCPAATEVFDCLSGHWRPFSWEEVTRQSTEILTDWEEDDLD